MESASKPTSNEEPVADNASTSDAPANDATPIAGEDMSPMDIRSFRRFIAPLSKEQLIELLANAALSHPQVYEQSQLAVYASPASRRLMVRNIDFGTQDEDFVALFKEYGDVEDATIVRTKDQRSRGYGFVTYKKVDSVRRVLETTLTLDGRQLLSKLAADPFADFSSGAPGGSAGPRGLRRKLFVRNLSDSTDSVTLKEVFSTYGELEECAVVEDPMGRSRGYGFVTYSTPEAAIKAVQQPQLVINGRVAFVAFAAPSKPKNYPSSGASSQQARLENQMNALVIPPGNPNQFRFPAFAACPPPSHFFSHSMFPQQIYATGLPLGVPGFPQEYEAVPPRQRPPKH